MTDLERERLGDPAAGEPWRDELVWRNRYVCPECGGEWFDEWSCQCDDDCPECGCRHVEPTDSEWIGEDEEEE